MNKEKFISFMQKPDSLNKQSMDELAYLINEFPYCQSAHILLSLSQLKENSILFESSLKTTAIYASNRRVLKKHIDRLSIDSKSSLLHDEGLAEKEKTTKTESENKENKEEIKKPDKTSEPIIELEPAEKIKSRSLADLKKIVEKRIREIEREKKEKTKNTVKPKGDANKGNDLIDKFIKDQPVISRNQVDFYNAHKEAASSIVDQDNIVSETLASIYIDQKHFGKAINIYQKLSLKYPKKSSYFAALIKKAKKENNNKK